MALLVTGFGLRDSIIDLADIQYDNIQLYDAMITFSGTEEEKKDLGQWLENEKDVAASTMVHMEMVDVSTGGRRRGSLSLRSGKYRGIPDHDRIPEQSQS